MIPVSDTVRSRTTPYVNLAIIAVNFLVFFYEISLSQADLNLFFFDHGVVPRRLVDWWNSPSGLEEPFTIVSAAFIHGGWLHILGNMIYLWVFGDNIEDALGHVKYAIFYLVAATGAVVLQVAVDTNEVIPMVGASGAIAGVMGAYFVLFPHSRVLTLVPIFFYAELIEIPAIFFLGIWFFMQLLSGVGSIGLPGGGVAFWAHAAGFLAGAALVLLFRRPERQRIEWIE